MVFFTKNDEEKRLAERCLSDHELKAKAAIVTQPISSGPVLIAVPGSETPTMVNNNARLLKERGRSDKQKFSSIKEIKEHLSVKKIRDKFLIIFHDTDMAFGSDFIILNSPYMVKYGSGGTVHHNYMGPRNSIKSVNNTEVKNLISVYDFL